MRTSVFLQVTLLCVLLLAACAGDDGAPGPTPGASVSPTTTVAPPTDATSLPTPPPDLVIATPGRELPGADHIAYNVINPLLFYEQRLAGGALTPVICAGVDLGTGIIDCVDAGYGTIAVDPIPQVASGELTCRALLDPQNVFFAASCSGILPSGPGAYIYAIQE
jgi:hypothetical protein